jgi:hypothetical protein
VKGFSISKIPEGKPGAGIKVVTLHYSADPTMTPERVAKLKAKYPDPTVWDREMEIDPFARGGKRVFPGFSESVHVVEPFLPLKATGWTVWLACDPHPRRAHGFVWLAVNKYGEMTVPWSWWPEDANRQREQAGKSRLLIKEYAEGLREVENARLFPASYIELMDSAGKNFNADEEHNFFDGYEKEGVIFLPAKKNREYAGYDLINDALALKKFTYGAEEIEKPILTIMRGCGDNDQLIRQMRSLRFREFKGPVTDKDPPADPMEKERHLVDCLSYILLDGPRFIEPYDGGDGFTPIYPKLGY